MAKETFSVVNKEGVVVASGLTLAAAQKAARQEAKKFLVTYIVKNEKGKKVYIVKTALDAYEP